MSKFDSNQGKVDELAKGLGVVRENFVKANCSLFMFGATPVFIGINLV